MMPARFRKKIVRYRQVSGNNHTADICREQAVEHPVGLFPSEIFKIGKFSLAEYLDSFIGKIIKKSGKREAGPVYVRYDYFLFLEEFHACQDP
jgi:hypothetical protein